MSGEPELAGQKVVVIGGTGVAGRGPTNRSVHRRDTCAYQGREQLRATLPIGHVVSPADIAALAVHLMTNRAVTGARYGIDGGQQLVEV